MVVKRTTGKGDDMQGNSRVFGKLSLGKLLDEAADLSGIEQVAVLAELNAIWQEPPLDGRPIAAAITATASGCVASYQSGPEAYQRVLIENNQGDGARVLFASLDDALGALARHILACRDAAHREEGRVVVEAARTLSGDLVDIGFARPVRGRIT